MSKEKKQRKNAEKIFSDYQKFYVVPETVTEESAKEISKRTISQKRWVHADFVKRLDAVDVKTQKLYVPVYKSACVVEYTLFKEGGETENLSRRVEKTFTPAPDYLNAGGDLGECSEANQEQKKEAVSALFPNCLVKAEKNKKALKKALKGFDVGNGKINREQYEYAVVFVPVLKLTYSFGDQSYESFVGLNGGACEADYPVSPELAKGVDKTVKRAKGARRYSFFALLFTLAFAGLAWYKRFLIDKEAVAFSTVVILSALAALPLMTTLSTLAFKRKKLAAAAKEKGKIKKSTGAAFFTLLSWACAVASLVLFAIEAL